MGQELILKYAPKVMDIFKKMEDNLPKEVKDALETVAAEAKQITSKGEKPTEKELKKWAEDIKKAVESIKKDDATLSEEEKRNIEDVKAIMKPLENLKENNAVQIVGEVVAIARNTLPSEKLGELANALEAATDFVPAVKLQAECLKADLEEAAKEAAKADERKTWDVPEEQKRTPEEQERTGSAPQRKRAKAGKNK